MKGPPNVPIWVIYDHPRDFPDHYVVRVHHCGSGVVAPDPVGQLASSLEEARGLVPSGHMRVEPRPQDDSVIVEWWV